MHAFEVLADPVRRRIMELIAGGERSAGEIGTTVQAEFGITQPGVSRHLRTLRDTGFASVRIDGPRRMYRAEAAPMAEAEAWLARYGRFWTRTLDALGDELARDDAARPTGPATATPSPPDDGADAATLVKESP